MKPYFTRANRGLKASMSVSGARELIIGPTQNAGGNSAPYREVSWWTAWVSPTRRLGTHPGCLTAKRDHENGYRLVLSANLEGEYTVYYRDPDGSWHEIGPIEIGIV